MSEAIACAFYEPLLGCAAAANGGLLHDPVVGGARKKRTEPAAVVGFHQGGAERLRRSTIFVSGMHKMRRQPEAVGKFITGAQRA